MTHSPSAVVLGRAICDALNLVESGGEPTSAYAGLRQALEQVGLTEETLNAVGTEEFYLIKGDDGEETYYSILPRTAEVDAYLFTHSRRKANRALVNEVAALVRGTEMGRAFLGELRSDETLESLIRNTLNINNTGRRYGRTTENVDGSALLHDKVGALANFTLYATINAGQVSFTKDDQPRTALSFARIFEYDVYSLPDSVVL